MVYIKLDRFILILLFFLFWTVKPVFSQVVINEVMPSNTWTKADPDFGNYGDWIELYNPTSSSVNLKGFSISDKANFSKSFTFPTSHILAPKSYVLLWADDLSLVPGQTISKKWKSSSSVIQAYHLNFKLKAGGEGVYLKNSDGVLIDQLKYDPINSDVSLVKVDSEWEYSGFSSPGYLNGVETSTSQEQVDPIIFSKPSGFYNSSISIELKCINCDTIYFTLDGTIPTFSDSIYTTPIQLSNITTVRAKGFTSNKCSNNVSTATYSFVNIPIDHFYITIDSMDLWNSEHGIYQNSRKDHEIPATLEYFNDKGQPEFQINAGVSLFGSTIFQLEQKPFSVSLDNKFGTDVLSYPLFSDKKIGVYKEFVLRNGGNDYNSTMLRDGFLATLGGQMNSIAYQAYKPAIVFLNGEYWGLYNIREKMNGNYLASNNLVSPDRVDILEDKLIVKEGSSADFIKLYTFIKNNKLENPSNYSRVKNRIDIDAFMDYIILKSYIGYVIFNVNNKYWRSHDEGKWRWLSFDLEHGFGCCGGHQPYQNTLEEYINNPTNEYSLSIFNSLLQNKEFRDKFSQRYFTYLQTVFEPNNVISLLNTMSNKIDSEIPFHLFRWENTQSLSNWYSEIDNLRQFAFGRSQFVKGHIVELLGNPEIINLSLQASLGGSVKLNDIKIKDAVWEGKVFGHSKSTLEAIPSVGFKFSHWSDGDLNPVKKTIPLNNEVFEAFFVVDSQSVNSTINVDVIWDRTDKSYVITEDLTIDSLGSLLIKKGVTVKLDDCVKLIVKGRLTVEGTQSSPVIIEALNERWGNISLINSTDTVVFRNVNITGAGYGEDYERSAISAEGTNLIIDSSKIYDCLQPLHTIGGSVKVENSFFHMDFSGDLLNITKTNNAQVNFNELRGNKEQDTDAVDFDGVIDGQIQGNWIYGLRGSNSDGIDLGEDSRNIHISDNQIYYCSDKGVSIGQNSSAIVENNIITFCGMGVAVKDEGSEATMTYNTMFANKYGLASFEKNPGKGGGKINATYNLITYSDNDATLVDKKSILIEANNVLDHNIVMYEGAVFNNYQLLNNDSIIGAILPYYAERHPKVLINEINYTVPNDCDVGEWVEVYNLEDNELSMSGWEISDGSKFGEILNTTIDENSFAVFSNNKQLYESKLEQLSHGSFEFKLNKKGERLYLFDDKGMIVNSVYYNDSNSLWPNTSPISLNVGELNNLKGENWFSNSRCVGTPSHSNDSLIEWLFLQKKGNVSIYPNPTSGRVTFSEFLNYEVYSIIGELILEGEGLFVELESIVPGVYLLKTGKGTFRIIKQ